MSEIPQALPHGKPQRSLKKRNLLNDFAQKSYRKMDKEHEITPCLKAADGYIKDLESQLKRKQEFFIEERATIKEFSETIVRQDEEIHNLNRKIRRINIYNNVYLSAFILTAIIVIVRGY